MDGSTYEGKFFEDKEHDVKGKLMSTDQTSIYIGNFVLGSLEG